MLAFPFRPKNITINVSGNPKTADQTMFVHAFFFSLKEE